MEFEKLMTAKGSATAPRISSYLGSRYFVLVTVYHNIFQPQNISAMGICTENSLLADKGSSTTVDAQWNATADLPSNHAPSRGGRRMQHHVYEMLRTNRSPETALPELCSEDIDYKNKKADSYPYQKGAPKVKGAATNICAG